MPLPPLSFTKSKWLACFAELSAKITHHNLLVGIEGCEKLKRLLISHISVAALLQEGDLLQSLLDTLVGGVREAWEVGGTSVALNEELTLAQLETVAFCVDMMVSLYADGDAYYSLLVMARAGVIIKSLLGLLQCGHPHFHGLILNLLFFLLSLPIGREVSEELSGAVTDTHSVALRRHIEELTRLVHKQGLLLQDATDSLTMLVVSCTGPRRFGAMRLLNVARKRLQKFRLRQRNRSDLDNSSGRGECHGGLNSSDQGTAVIGGNDDASCTADCSELNVTITGVPPALPGEAVASVPSNVGASTLTTEEQLGGPHMQDVSALVDQQPPETPYVVPVELIESTLDTLAECRSHGAFFSAMNDVWCLTVADGAGLATHLTLDRFAVLRRFMLTAPVTRQDRCLFTLVLLWVGHMITSFALQANTRDAILDVCGSSLLHILKAECEQKEGARQRAEPSAAPLFFTAAASPRMTISAAGPVDSLSCTLARGREQEAALQLDAPSVALVLFSFLLNVQQLCSAQQVEDWVRVGNVLGVIEQVIRRVEKVKSVLIDTPTTMDGALSDEVYLSCAMKMVHSGHVTLAVLACKLLASLLWSHFDTLRRALVVEVTAMIRVLFPLLLAMAVHNPTLTSAKENVSGSALHHSPSGLRSSRYTSLGECAVVALDACLWFSSAASVDCVDLALIVGSIGALSRCTCNSIHPPLRAIVYRTLAHLCRSPSHVIMIVQDMPSVINAAVASVLKYHKAAPQWEAAAAAEWLCHVLDSVSSNPNVERSFNLLCTSLPMKLLEITSSAPVGYATAALLRLCVFLFEQQRRFEEHSQETSHNVLVPYGRRSLNAWLALIRAATTANEELARLNQKTCARPPSAWDMCATTPSTHAAHTSKSVPSKDALSRVLSAAENIAVQYAYTGSLFCGLKNLFTVFPEHRGHFTHHILYNLFGSSFALPSPKRVLEFISSWFGARLDHHPTLTKAYDELVQWACELAPLWFEAPASGSAFITRSFPPIPAEVFVSLSRIMRDESLSQRTRCHVPIFVCSLLVLTPANAAVHHNMALHSNILFDASLFLKQLVSVKGMQCRLLHAFQLANQQAHHSGWFAQRVLELQKLTKSLRGCGGALGADNAETFLVTLSLVSSVVSNPEGVAVPSELRQPLCEAFAECLRFEHTRLTTLHVLRAMAYSDEGRRCLLHEITSAGEPLARSCFGRLLALTLEVPTQSALQQDRVLASKSLATGGDAGDGVASLSSVQELTRMTMSSSPPPPALREIIRRTCINIGYDICTTVCGKGGNPFVAVFLRHRGIETLEKLFCFHDSQRRDGAVPLPLLRLTAGLSFSLDAQKALFQHGTLFTIILEVAGDATTEGCLALLVVRNLCFHPALKTLLCQDPRVLITLKAALLGQPTVEPLVRDVAHIEGREGTPLVPKLRLEIAEQQTPSLLDWAKKAMRRSIAPAPAPTPTPATAARQSSDSDARGKRAARVTGNSPRGAARKPETNTPRLPELCSATPSVTSRRQELAVSAFWSLLHDHQRGRAYVKSVLQQTPAVVLDDLLAGSLQEACQAEGRYTEELVGDPVGEETEVSASGRRRTSCKNGSDVGASSTRVPLSQVSATVNRRWENTMAIGLENIKRLGKCGF